MKKVEIGDVYIIPSGTQLWFIDLQQSLITTKKYVIKVTHTLYNNNTSFFGDLYEIRSQPNEIFVNGATISNIEVIDALTSTNLRTAPGSGVI